jgi:hypothetical protein
MFNAALNHAADRKRRTRTAAVFTLAVLAGWAFATNPCLTLYFRGVEIPYCPEGSLLPLVSMTGDGLVRGEKRAVAVKVSVLDARGFHEGQPHCMTGGTVALSLLDAAGKEQPFAEEGPEDIGGCQRMFKLTVPSTLPDGEYTLRATATTWLGKATADAQVPLFAPARIQVLTNSPLYKPGDTVKFRAVALRADDFTPLDHRPGRWTIRTPEGDTVFDEDSPAGEWGVASGSFPLQSKAPSGEWQIAWTSQEDSGSAEFTVAAFELPRFHVDLTPDQRFYGPGDRPSVSGKAAYSSGAPIPKAAVHIEWKVDGQWPPPTEWMDGELPETATTDSSGAFTLKLPEIPDDLRGRVTLKANVTVTDRAGDTISGATALLLSEHPIEAEAVTEFENGLAAKFNNRLFLRISDPAGSPLPNTKINVRRKWDAADRGLDVEADEDGVASLQIDPGAPLHVLVPPMPIRKAKPAPLVARADQDDVADELLPSFADEKAMDAWPGLLEPCTRFVHGTAEGVNLHLAADRTGRITDAVTASTPVARCVRDTVRTQRLTAGGRRVFSQLFTLSPAPLAEINATCSGSSDNCGDFEVAADDARICFLPKTRSVAFPDHLIWRVAAGGRKRSVEWLEGPSASGISSAVRECLHRKFRDKPLAEPATEDGLGVVSLEIKGVEQRVHTVEPAQTKLGYELLISAAGENAPARSTTIFIPPGEVPRLRLRATPTMAKPGDEITVEMIRGPTWQGPLPRSISVGNGRQILTALLDYEHRKVKYGSKDEEKGWITPDGREPLAATLDPARRRTFAFRLPSRGEGWFKIQAQSVTTHVFVAPAAQLSVALKTDHPAYKPGATAHLDVETKSGDRGTKAAVGLFGVDDTMAALVALPGPDAFQKLHPTIPMSGASFAQLDGEALVFGRVRGRNAAAAIMAKVGDPEGLGPTEARPTAINAMTTFDGDALFLDGFYNVLSELHAQVRDWNERTPAGIEMHPKTMAELWGKALDACAQKGERASDAFGRRLRLSIIPRDLLALADPRMVVNDGTRLPEDVEDWAGYVAKERP